MIKQLLEKILPKRDEVVVMPSGNTLRMYVTETCFLEYNPVYGGLDRIYIGNLDVTDQYRDCLDDDVRDLKRKILCMCRTLSDEFLKEQLDKIQ